MLSQLVRVADTLVSREGAGPFSWWQEWIVRVIDARLSVLIRVRELIGDVETVQITCANEIADLSIAILGCVHLR